MNARAESAESLRNSLGRELLGDPVWAAVAWSIAAEACDSKVAEWIARYGLVESLDRLISRDLDDAAGRRERLVGVSLDRVRDALARRAVRVVIPGEREWPDGLDLLDHPPYCLYVKGEHDLTDALEGAVAIVGSRAATAYGTRMAADLGADLARRGVTVVSGAAFGIDAAAHRGALAVDGLTAAVLACGLDRAYPSAHARLIAQISESGLLLSEVPLGGAPFRHRFLQRNRIIALVTAGTVVVEAGLRSGSRNTSKWAREHHRHVAAVPGPVTSAASAGCHEEIRTYGATLVTDAAEVLDLMGRLGLDLAEPKSAPPTLESALDAEAARVWSVVPVRSPSGCSALAALSGVSDRTALRVLGRLEMEGLVIRSDEGWRKTKLAGQHT